MPTNIAHTRTPEPAVRITLELHPLYEAADTAIKEPGVDNFKEFCKRLRLSKLMWYHYDRQEPKAFDYGGEQLLQEGEKVLAAVEAFAEGWADVRLDHVRRAIREDHLNEIRERLYAMPTGRIEIDQARLSRLNRVYRPIAPVVWSGEAMSA